LDRNGTVRDARGLTKRRFAFPRDGFFGGGRVERIIRIHHDAERAHVD
jgi:hypothetical protein